MNKKEVDKVTVSLLRDIGVGEEVGVVLPTAVACHNGKSLVYQTARMWGWVFRCVTMYEDKANILRIRREK